MVMQVEYILRWETYNLLIHRSKRLPYLEFKDKLHGLPWPCWKRAYQKCSQQWAVCWGTDYDTQKYIVRERKKQSNDAMEKIKV